MNFGRACFAFALLPLANCASSPPTPTSSSVGARYFERLGALSDGGSSLTEQARKRILEAPAEPLEAGMAGLRFGASMDDVIAVWGRPSRIWIQGDERTQLGIAKSTFEFIGDRLVEIDVHEADLPTFSIANGQVAMGKACPNLTVVFPGALPTADNDGDTCEVQLPSGVIVNAYSVDGAIISISIAKP